MFSKILYTRMQRFLKNDKNLPTLCKNKWFFNDVTLPCKCKDVCIYEHFTLTDWYKYCDKMYYEYCKENRTK